MAGTLGIATLETGVDTRGLETGLNKSKNTSTSFLDEVKTGFANKFGMSAADAAMKAAGAVYDFARESLAEFKAFESGIAEVFTLLPDASAASMDQMKRDVLAFGVEVGRTSDEVLPALYQAISAGVPAENVFDFLAIASDAALGGVTDLETAVDGISSVVNAYGDEVLSAAEASDIMFTAVRLGKTDFGQLSSSLFNVIPTAASLGVSFADVASQLAVLTSQGTPTSVATTQIRAAFVEASRDGTRLSDAIKDLTGKSFPELIADGYSTSEIFDMLRRSMPENEFRRLFGSVEAMNAVLGITGPNAQAAADAFEQTSDSLGATTAAADIMRETGEQASRELAAAWEFLKITAGEQLGPTVTALTREFTDLVIIVGDAIRIGADLVYLFQEIISLGTERAIEALSTGFENLVERGGWLGSAAEWAGEKLGLLSVEAEGATVATLGSAEATNEYRRELLESTEAVAEHILADEAATAAVTAHTLRLNEQTVATIDASAEAAEFGTMLADLRVAQDEAAEAARAHAVKLGEYFDAALTAGGETKSLEMQLYEAAVASGAGAAELMILAAATGEFTAAEIEAAFQAAVMRENIELLAAAVANGTVTAETAVTALGHLQEGTASSAEAALRLAADAGSAEAALRGVDSAAQSATGALNNIPTNIPVHISITSSGLPDLPGAPAQAFSEGGWTGEAGGIVHANELVIPAPVIRSGAAGILDFAQMHVPGGIEGEAGGSVTIHVDARGATDPAAVEAAGYRGAQAALREAGMTADVYRRMG